MLIGARIGCWSGGKLSAKSYVQDGLIAMWDAIDRSGSTDGNWIDLVDSRAITGSAWTFSDDAFVSSDTTMAVWGDSAGTTLFPYLQTIASTNCTFEVCGKLGDWSDISSVTSAWASRMFANIDSHYGRGFEVSQVYSPRVGFDCGTLQDNAQITYANWFKPVPTGRFNSTFVNDSSADWSHFVNGAFVYSSANKYASSWRKGVAIGGTTGTEICNYRVYNRVLTADEIAANYAVDAARFNLT